MNQLKPIERNNQRVMTTSVLADEYGTTEKVISNNFNNNKDRYTEGKHFYCLEGEELRQLKSESYFLGIAPNINKLYLWTEKGALLHAKSLNTDRAWEMYEFLVDTYFKAIKPMTTIELMKLQMQAINEINVKVDDVDKDLQNFKTDMPLLALECDRITTAVKKKGVRCLGGKDSVAYHDKSLRGKVYADIHRELKRQYGVTSYKALKRQQCDEAIEIVESYQLPMVLKSEIECLNDEFGFVI